MQSTEKNPKLIVNFSLVQLAEILVKSQGLHEGLYNLSIEFQIGVGAIGPSPESICPGAMIGISRIGLLKTEESKKNIHTVNAAEVNPAPKKRSHKTKT
jgi:hypothetical protein